MTTADERRAAVWGLLATHARVQWNGRGDDVAFADEVLELAARLGRVGDVPALRPVRVASPAAQKAAYKDASDAIAAAKKRREQHVPLMTAANATGAAVSDSEGQVGTRTPPERPGASEGGQSNR